MQISADLEWFSKWHHVRQRGMTPFQKVMREVFCRVWIFESTTLTHWLIGMNEKREGTSEKVRWKISPTLEARHKRAPKAAPEKPKATAEVHLKDVKNCHVTHVTCAVWAVLQCFSEMWPFKLQVWDNLSSSDSFNTSHFSSNLPLSHCFDAARCSKPGFPDQNGCNLNLQKVRKVLTVQAMPGLRSNCTTAGLLSCVAAGRKCQVAGPSGRGGNGAA